MTDDPQSIVAQALAGESAWLVGGAVRDQLLGRPTTDIDITVKGDIEPLAKALAKAIRGTPFPLSEEFGGWRVVARKHAWHADLLPLKHGDLDADLDARDFTVNALAQPLAGGAIVDRHGGQEDLANRRLRVVTDHALSDDPLRVWRAARCAHELGLTIEPDTLALARSAAERLDRVSPERVFAEFKRLLASPDPVGAITLAYEVGAYDVWLPELVRLRGVEQSAMHADDVWDHTLVVLGHVTSLDEELLGEPFSDELDRGTALRIAALMHDIGKPQTRNVTDEGWVTFWGHDEQGGQIAREILRRLRASERLVNHVSAIVRWHLRAGRVWYERRRAADLDDQLRRRLTWRFLRDCGPVAADVCLLALCDRRGNDSDADLSAYHAIIRELYDAALEERAAGKVTPLIRGDELARALGRTPGPWLAEALAGLEEDRYAGLISTPDEAIARAKSILSD